VHRRLALGREALQRQIEGCDEALRVTADVAHARERVLALVGLCCGTVAQHPDVLAGRVVTGQAPVLGAAGADLGDVLALGSQHAVGSGEIGQVQ